MKHTMNSEQQKKFWAFIRMNDFEFYETYIAKLSSDAQQRFLEETPDFFSEYTGEPDSIDLNTDKIYQNIMKTIQQLNSKSNEPF